MPFFRSIAAKLFYAITGIGIFVVLGTTMNHLYTVHHFVDDRLRDALTAKAKEAADGVSGLFENWQSQATIAAQLLDQETTKKSRLSLEKLLDSNREILALYVVDQTLDGRLSPVDAVTTRFTDGEYFEGYDPNDVINKLRTGISAELKTWMRNDKGGASIHFANLSPGVGLPVLTIGIPFMREGTKDLRWFVMTVWQARLIALLPGSSSTVTRVVLENGQLLTSTSKADVLKGKNLAGAIVFEAAKKGGGGSGFMTFKDGNDADAKEMIGAFATVPRNGLSVLVEQDPSVARLSTRVMVLQAALWGWLFVMIAFLASFFGSDLLTRPLRLVTDATARIAAGDFSPDLSTKSRDEVGVVSRAVGRMAVKIEQLLRASVEAARQEKELATAKLVQSTFMPLDRIETAGVKIVGYNKPASETGGDLWGHYELGGGLEFVFVADATGHGAAAAFVTAMAHSCCMTVLAMRAAFPVHEVPTRVAEMFNDVLYRTTKSRMAMTFQGLLLDTQTGRIWLSNAGHPFPIMLKSNEEEDLTDTKGKFEKSVKFVRVSGNPLGMFPEAKYPVTELMLGEGEKTVLYTDGLTEGRSPAGKMLGREKVRRILGPVVKGDAEAVQDRLIGEAMKFYAGEPQDDDITVVVIERLKTIEKTGALNAPEDAAS